MPSLAIIADTHGNHIALEAVLSEIEREGANEIVCLGDVAGLGPQPRETLARLRGLGCPMVMGNADEFLLDPSALDPEQHPDADENLRRMHEIEQWCAEQLDESDRAFLRSFRPVVELSLDGAGMLCYHGSPRSNREEIRASTPDSDLAEMLGERRDLMAGGHTHEQFSRRLNRTIVLNPGSVGLPYEITEDGEGRNPPWAEYAIVSHHNGRLSVDLRRVPIDLEAIRAALASTGMPHAEWWAADLR